MPDEVETQVQEMAANITEETNDLIASNQLHQAKARLERNARELRDIKRQLNAKQQEASLSYTNARRKAGTPSLLGAIFGGTLRRMGSVTSRVQRRAISSEQSDMRARFMGYKNLIDSCLAQIADAKAQVQDQIRNAK